LRIGRAGDIEPTPAAGSDRKGPPGWVAMIQRHAPNGTPVAATILRRQIILATNAALVEFVAAHALPMGANAFAKAQDQARQRG